MRALLVPILWLVFGFAPPQAERAAPESPAPVEPLEPTEVVEIVEPASRFVFETFEDDPIGVKQIVLDNGLTVLLSENHERPAVFGAVVVNTGGKNDPADNTGMAHYLEHMLFKGTTALGTSDWGAEQPLQDQIVALYERHAATTDDAERAALQAEIGRVVEQTYAYAIPNELDKMLAESGGSGVNAFTTEDETVYHNTFPASQIETWLEVYAHRFVDPVFRLFPTELEAVYEEKNISLDRFEVKLLESVQSRAFPTHPYGTQTVIGDVEDLESPSLVAMRAYFDEYYVANNMALVLSGDIDAEAIMPLIEAKFGAWRSGPEPAARGGEVAAFDGRELVKLRVTPVRVGAYGFRTAAPDHADYAALLVARALLFNEQGSGFIDRLMDEGKILIALPYVQDYADHGFDVVFFAPKILGQTFKNAETRVLDAFHKLGRGEFDEGQMLALRDGLRRAEDLQWEDNEQRALALASSFIRHQDWQGYLDFRARLAAVTRAEVMRVGQTYFGDDYLALRSRLGFPKKPRLSKPHYPAVTPQPGVHSPFYDAVMGRPSPPAALRYVDFDADISATAVAPGVTLLANGNPFNDTYSLELRFGVGTEAIRELRVAVEYLGRVGAGSRTPAELREELSLLGTTIDFGASADETVVSLTGPEQHLERALALVDDLLQAPIASSERLRALRRERRGVEKVSRRDPGYVARAARDYAMYGDNSSFLRDYGRCGMTKLRAKQLLQAWSEAQRYALELRYTGARDSAEVATIIQSTLALGRGRRPAVAPIVYPRVLPAEDTVFFLPRRDALQTRLYFVVDGDPVAAPQRPVADAYAEYIGGSMAGLVFQEIREFRALAYSASGYFYRDPTPAQAGYFLGSVGCQADKTLESIEVMRALITDMPAKPERMSALVAALVRRQETRSPGFRELIAQVDRWRESGYASDPREAALAAYPTLSFDDIDNFYRSQVADRPMTLVVVGDPRRVKPKQLRAYGELIKLRPSQVFAK